MHNWGTSPTFFVLIGGRGKPGAILQIRGQCQRHLSDTHHDHIGESIGPNAVLAIEICYNSPHFFPSSPASLFFPFGISSYKNSARRQYTLVEISWVFRTEKKNILSQYCFLIKLFVADLVMAAFLKDNSKHFAICSLNYVMCQFWHRVQRITNICLSSSKDQNSHRRNDGIFWGL